MIVTLSKPAKFSDKQVSGGKMQNKNIFTKFAEGSEQGAALVTVLMISVLLGTACIAMLSAVGASSRNNTDALSEAKAYYAAESGLQATINILRNDTSVDYKYAIAHPDLATKLSYATVDGISRVQVGSEAGYSITITDPDHSGDAQTFNATGGFLPYYINGSNQVVNIQGTCLPSSANCTSVQYGTTPNRTTIYIDNVSSTTVNFSSYSNPVTAIFRVVNEIGGTGTRITDPLRFNINYNMTAPRSLTATMRGTVTQPSNASNPITAQFDSAEYQLAGSDIALCSASNCPAVTLPFTRVLTEDATTNVWAHLDPVEPYRLMVKATGYGPSSAKKDLEAIIQHNFFNDTFLPSPLMMQGPGNGLQFNPGNSSVFEINGSDTGSGVTVPSIGVVDQTGLTTVLNGIPNNNNNIQPAPAVISTVPSWMATPQNLDALVSQLRTTAQNSGRYYDHPTSNLTNVGNYSTGTGITFCEGNCTAAVNGGGVLVVTGTLRNVGGWSFKGLIIVTGSGGWLRNGGGGGVVTGNVVIAPYGPNDLITNTFSIPPKYNVTGGGTSNIDYDEVTLDTAFNGTAAVSDFMLGIAEK